MRLIDHHTGILQQKKWKRKKPSNVYVTTMASPASSMDSPIASAVARATNVDIKNNDEEECAQTFIGSRVAAKLGVPLFWYYHKLLIERLERYVMVH